MENNRDLIFRLLHDDALANRPVFSSELHQRTMNAIHCRSTSIWFKTPWILTGLAAGVVLVLLAGVIFLARMPTTTVVALQPLPVEPAPLPSLPAVNLAAVQFRIKGIATAHLWPPEIRFELPLPISGPEPVRQQVAIASPTEGLPQVVLGLMQDQVNGADNALYEQVPNDLRSIIKSSAARRD